MNMHTPSTATGPNGRTRARTGQRSWSSIPGGGTGGMWKLPSTEGVVAVDGETTLVTHTFGGDDAVTDLGIDAQGHLPIE